jgi:hypothetical protein
MAKGAPRSAQQGVWYSKARRLRAEGRTYAYIAEACGVTPAAVFFVLNPDKRVQYAIKRAAKETTSATQSS